MIFSVFYDNFYVVIEIIKGKKCIMKSNNLRKNSEYNKYRQINGNKKNSNQKRKNFLMCIILIFLIFVAIFCFLKFNLNEVFNVNNSQLDVAENLNSKQVVENTNTTQEKPISFSLSAIGDVMCHNSQYIDAYISSTDSYDFSYVFEDVKDYIQSADIAIGNLETSFAGKEVRV